MKLTQTMVIREARKWGVQCDGRDGPDPSQGGLTDEDVKRGHFECVKGDPELSLHELVHGILGAPLTVDEEGNDVHFNDDDECLLVEPLEHAILWQMGDGQKPSDHEMHQLIAAQLWRAGQFVYRSPDGEDWDAARGVMKRREYLVYRKELRERERNGRVIMGFYIKPELPEWW